VKKLVSIQNFADVLSDLTSHQNLGLDTETQGLLEHHKLFSIQIATEFYEYYFDFTHELPRDYIAKMDVLWSSKAHTWFIQNAKFDLGMLSKDGVTIKGVVLCTKMMERLIKNDHFGAKPYSLAALAARRGWEKDTRVEKYISEHKLYTDVVVLGKGKTVREPHFDRVPFQTMFDYGCQDARLHYDIGKAQVETLEALTREQTKPAPFKQVFTNEVKLTRVCHLMERQGVRVDRGYCIDGLDYELKMAEVAKKEFGELTGETFSDSRVVFRRVFDKFNLPYKLTAKGNPSFDKNALSDIDHPVADIVTRIRKHEKYAGTYYSSFLYQMDDNDIFRGWFDPSSTVTGRFSSNVQQLPKKTAGEYDVRRCFIPREGKCLIDIDYSQIEYRILADYADERYLIKKINEGEDVHQATADLLGITRDHAKTVNFACVAEDQLVLTKRGLVKIQNVSKEDLLWDGVDWVSHGGVVYMGIKEVINVQGVEVTPEHEVFTDKGRKIQAWVLSCQQGVERILNTEINGEGCRVPDAYADDSYSWETLKNKSKVRSMFEKLPIILRQHFIWKDNKLPMSARTEAQNTCREFVSKAVPGSKNSMSIRHALKNVEKLWCSRNKNTVLAGGVDSILYGELHSGSDNVFGYRQNRQQRTLRDWELEAGYKVGEPVKQKDCRKKAKVYDIINSGPRHRFTVSGKLVSNCLYGTGVDSLSKMLNVKFTEARDIRRRYFSKLPGIAKFLKDVSDKAAARGFIINWFGRRLHLFDKQYSYIMLNYLIQSSAADLMKRSMVRCYDELDFTAEMTIHDEVKFDLEPERFDLIPKIVGIMETSFNSRNGIKIEAGVAHSWKSFSKGDLVEGVPT